MLDFSILPPRSFRDPDSHRVVDLAVFYRYIYEFWYYGGKWGALLTRLVDLVNSVVLWVVVFVLAVMFEWEGALACEGAKCAEVRLLHSPRLPTEHNLALFVFIAACGAAVLWEFRRCVEGYYLLKEVHHYVKHTVQVQAETPLHDLYYRLRAWYHSARGRTLIDGDDDGAPAGAVRMPAIEDLSWADFLHLVTQKLQQDRGITDYRAVDELRYVQTLMLIENYQVALHHHGILSQAPLCYADEAVVRFLIESQMIGYRIRADEDAERKLREKLFVTTLLQFLAYPFVVSFMLTKFLVKSVAEFRTQPGQLFHVGWNSNATWRFRLYNEVPHYHSARLRKADDLMKEMNRRASGSRESPLRRVLQRTSAAVLLVIVVATTLNTSLLNYGALSGRTLFWWFSVAVVIFGATAGDLLVEREYNHEADLRELTVHLHYDQAVWHRSTQAFVDDLARSYLERRISSMIVAFASVLFRPFLLLWIYHSDALKHLVVFIRNNNTVLPGVGSICRMSTFNVKPEGSSCTDLEAMDAGHGMQRIDDGQDEELHSASSFKRPGRTSAEVEVRGDGEGDGVRGSGSGMAPAESFEWKVEKSLVSFAAIYGQWLARQQSLVNDDLGINDMLRRLDLRIQSELGEGEGDDLDDVPLRPAPQLAKPTVVPALRLRLGDPRGREETESEVGPLPSARRTVAEAKNPHDREQLTVAMIDALQRSTWIMEERDPRRGSRPIDGSQMYRVGSYGSSRERDLTALGP